MTWEDAPAWIGAGGGLAGIIGAAAAMWQARIARRSATIAKSALKEAKKQSVAATRSAKAAESQAEIASLQFESEKNRNRATDVRNVRTALIAAKEIRDELDDYCRKVIERNNRPRRSSDILAIDARMFMAIASKENWDSTMETIRSHNLPDQRLVAEFEAYSSLVATLSQAIEKAFQMADARQLSKVHQDQLEQERQNLNGSYSNLNQACKTFLESRGSNANNLPGR